MDPDELRERIAEFPRWHYKFQFDNGVSTPVSHLGQVNRHEQRRGYFFDALLRLTGGSLEGKRVLDLGCNAGFWSLLAIEAGADFVLGIDANPTYIEQASLVFETKGVDRARYRFERANIFEHDVEERFDVVLCLGMFEVTARPLELFELMASTSAEIVVIDTLISRAGSSFFELSRLLDPRSRVDHELVLIPTRHAVIELAEEFGFDAVPIAHEMADYSGLDDYREQRRLAFMCAKSLSLDAVPRAKSVRPPAPWWLELINPVKGWQRLRGV